MKELEILRADNQLSLKAFQLAIEDGHFIPKPDYVAVLNGSVVGAFSAAAAPFVFLWVKLGQKMLVSVKILKAAEQRVRELGFPGAVIPITKDSPFRPYMERLGYVPDNRSEILCVGTL